LECKKNEDCIWDFNKANCKRIVPDIDIRVVYKEARIGDKTSVTFDNNGRCFYHDNPSDGGQATAGVQVGVGFEDFGGSVNEDIPIKK
jgi:hypothetical protein